MTFDEQRKIALAILTGDPSRISRRAGSFIGQCTVDDTPLTPKQSDWFRTLAERAGVSLPHGGAND